MSRSYAMVKFKKTGNIYMGRYCGTSDILTPYICTPDECYDEKVDCYCSISYCYNLSLQHNSWMFPDNVTDLDEVEIYSDYGGGFYWPATGSESIKMIKDHLDPYDECYKDMVDGCPQWVKDFWKSIDVEEEEE